MVNDLRDREAPDYASADKVNVCKKIVTNGMCIGCGICAGTCPTSSLELQMNKFGEYVARFCGHCVECGLCLKVCPFYGSEINEDTIAREQFGQISRIHHTIEAGYYLACYAGNVVPEDLRLSRSSGGLASWFLAKLLSRGIVDRVACVVHNPDPSKLFQFALVKNAEEVWNAATSCYYPVEMSEVLRAVRQENLRFAFIGLPCFLKGLYKAMSADKKLSKRIIVLAGLVCSHLKSKFFADYLVRLAGADPKKVERVNFRKKRLGRPLNEYEFVCQKEDKGRKVELNLPISAFAWPKQLFKINACNYCDDIFAEVADVTFMDAWLPEYVNWPGGVGLVIARSELAMRLFEEGQNANKIQIEPIDVQKVIFSQRSKVIMKRERLPVRLALASRNGYWFPQKRLHPNIGNNIRLRLDVGFHLHRIAASRIAFVKQQQAGRGLETFDGEMERRMRWYRLVRRLYNKLARVKRLIRSK